MSKRSVFIVDDHPLVREWLGSLINQQPDFFVAGEADNAPEALDAINRLGPDAVVVDITLKSSSGIELIKDIKATCPKVVILVLSMHEESLYAERALRAGARGYVMKRESTKKVIAGLRQVLEGKIFVSDSLASILTQRLLEGLKDGSDTGVDSLSDRELEVFGLLGQGLETKVIADTLKISIKTVQAYCARIKEKLGLHNATELLREAVRWGEHNQGSR